MEINSVTIHTDCNYFRGDLPCKPHKEFGYHCSNCLVYEPIKTRILIIKLGAIGDVIRTTPLVRKLRNEYPGTRITWLTNTPAILPQNEIEEILKYSFESVVYLQNSTFDLVINLDKDKDACALANTIKSDKKFGYKLENNVPYPMNDLANHKYLTGLFDDISKANKQSYVEEIFNMLGYEFNGEEYLFDNHEEKGYIWNLDKTKKNIGLNTGCGDRWTTRLWSEENWIELIEILKANGMNPVLLGGEQEHEKNLRLSKLSGALYLGHFGLTQFINLIYQMDIIVTQVTMAMHIAVGLKKPMILMNNIFNKHEFELYKRGTIVEPSKTCDCYFRGKCIHGTSCMETLKPIKVYESVSEYFSTVLI